MSKEEKKKPGRKKKPELSTIEKIELILDLERRLIVDRLNPKERFNTMHKRNTLKRELRKQGHDIPKKMTDLVQPKLTNWEDANAQLSYVDLVVQRIVKSRRLQKQVQQRIKKYKKLGSI